MCDGRLTFFQRVVIQSPQWTFLTSYLSCNTAIHAKTDEMHWVFKGKIARLLAFKLHQIWKIVVLSAESSQYTIMRYHTLLLITGWQHLNITFLFQETNTDLCLWQSECTKWHEITFWKFMAWYLYEYLTGEATWVRLQSSASHGRFHADHVWF